MLDHKAQVHSETLSSYRPCWDSAYMLQPSNTHNSRPVTSASNTDRAKSSLTSSSSWLSHYMGHMYSRCDLSTGIYYTNIRYDTILLYCQGSLVWRGPGTNKWFIDRHCEMPSTPL